MGPGGPHPYRDARCPEGRIFRHHDHSREWLARSWGGQPLADLFKDLDASVSLLRLLLLSSLHMSPAGCRDSRHRVVKVMIFTTRGKEKPPLNLLQLGLNDSSLPPFHGRGHPRDHVFTFVMTSANPALSKTFPEFPAVVTVHRGSLCLSDCLDALT